MSWSDGQVKSFVKQLRRGIGDGWRFMTDEVRTAIVEARVLGIVCGQHNDTINRHDVELLRARMLEAFGLLDDDRDDERVVLTWGEDFLQATKLTLREFIAANTDPIDPLGGDMVAELNELAVGRDAVFGGGATPVVHVRRIK